MSIIKYANAKIIGEDSVLRLKDVTIENGIITSILPTCASFDAASVPPISPNAEQVVPSGVTAINCEENLLIPGFINMHTHSAMTFLRSRADDTPLDEWLRTEIFPYEAKLTEEDQYWFQKLAYLEYLSGGTTTVFDMYLHNSASAAAAQDFKFPTVICGSVNDFGGTAEDLREDLKKYSNRPFTEFRLGFHAEYTTSETLLRDVVALSTQTNQGVWCHLNETAKEAQECVSRNGVPTTQYLDNLGIWNNGGGGFHAVHLTQTEREIAKERSLSLVTCPCSNLKLSSGIADLRALEDLHINICIGTDGPASNNALSMLREMYLTSVLQKNKYCDPTLMSPLTVLNMATKNGANALDINSGEIAVGKRANFALIDLHSPNTLLGDEIKNLIYTCSNDNVLMTIIDGEVRYNKGEFILPAGESVGEIYAQCQARSRRIFV